MAYEVFIRLHPRHNQVNYAYYQTAMSYFNALPKNNFFTPNIETKDGDAFKNTLLALERFIMQDPLSDKADETRKKISYLYSILAKKEQTIAQFYLKNDNYEAAVNRYKPVSEHYPDTNEAAESLYSAATILEHKLHDIPQATKLYEKIVLTKKESPYFKQAQEALIRLSKESD